MPRIDDKVVVPRDHRPVGVLTDLDVVAGSRVVRTSVSIVLARRFDAVVRLVHCYPPLS